jgi:hypothetical protein
MTNNTICEKAATEKFERTLVSIANDLIEELRDLPEHKRMGIIKRKIADSDVVVAIWNDPSGPSGVGYILLKGQDIARQAAAENRGVKAQRFAAMPCKGKEHAFALLDHLQSGDGSSDRVQ